MKHGELDGQSFPHDEFEQRRPPYDLEPDVNSSREPVNQSCESRVVALIQSLPVG